MYPSRFIKAHRDRPGMSVCSITFMNSATPSSLECIHIKKSLLERCLPEFYEKRHYVLHPVAPQCFSKLCQSPFRSTSRYHRKDDQSYEWWSRMLSLRKYAPTVLYAPILRYTSLYYHILLPPSGLNDFGRRLLWAPVCSITGLPTVTAGDVAGFLVYRMLLECCLRDFYDIPHFVTTSYNTLPVLQ